MSSVVTETVEKNDKPKLSLARETNWIKVLVQIQITISALCALHFLLYESFWVTTLFTFFLVFLGHIGVAAGARRLWAHRSYTANGFLRFFLVICQTLSGTVLDITSTESDRMLTTILTQAKAPEKSSKPNVVLRDAGKPMPSYPKYKFLKWEFKTPIIWKNVFIIALWHFVAVYGAISLLFNGNRWHFIYIVTVCCIGGFGVTGGAHRYFTHRSFKAKLPLRIILMLCYCTAGQNSLVDWVRDHRVHHKFSETDADPHNAKRGFFFSHVGWLMMRKHPEVIRKGKKIDIKDLFEDPVVIFHQKYFFWLIMLFCFIIPTTMVVFLFGESWYNSIMAICFVRYVITLNSTWAVNSVAHLWGNKPYDRKIFPSENLAVSFFTMGEGYHNYHHTFPWDYRAAEVVQLLNVTTLVLNFFGKIGWAYDMKAPSEQLINKVTQKHGDGSHYRRIYPSENLAVSLFAMGEGYHNYHHTFPWDYRTSELGKSLNVTTFWLNIFEKIGWAYDLKSPSEDLIKKVVQNHGDGSHYRWGHEVPIWENDAIELKEKKL